MSFLIVCGFAFYFSVCEVCTWLICTCMCRFVCVFLCMCMYAMHVCVSVCVLACSHVHVRVCTHVPCVCICVCAHVHVENRGWLWMESFVALHHIFEIRLLLNWSALIWRGCMVNELQESACLCLILVTDLDHCAWPFCGCWEPQLRSLCLNGMPY